MFKSHFHTKFENSDELFQFFMSGFKKHTHIHHMKKNKTTAVFEQESAEKMFECVSYEKCRKI